MKKLFSVILIITLIFTTVFNFGVSALEQDEIFENEYKVNDMYVMESQVFYVYNYDNLAMTFSSSDEEIIKNEGDGKFTALKSGDSIITISVGKASKSFTVTVKEASVTKNKAENLSQIGFYGLAEVFGEDKVTLLTSDGELYLAGVSGKSLIASDVKSYIRSENKDSWNGLYILTNEGNLIRWTYNIDTQKSSTDTVFAFTPKQICEKYVLSVAGNVYGTEDLSRLCINAVKITEYGYVLLNDGTVVDITKNGTKVTENAVDLDINNPLIIKDDGALFLYTYDDESEKYIAKLKDSSVKKFYENSSAYLKESCVKYYNGTKTAELFDFTPIDFIQTENVFIAVNESNTVYYNVDGIYGLTEKLGENFDSFYNENGNIGYTDISGKTHLVNGEELTNYSLDKNTNHFIDENNIMYAKFGSSQTIKVMENVVSLVNNPTDGNGTFILRDDNSVWYCDQWTWYPAKQTEESKFNPKPCVYEYTLGDVNEDGKITTKDARLSLRYTAKLTDLTAAQIRAADMDGNNKVNTKDARAILRYVAGLSILDYINQ